MSDAEVKPERRKRYIDDGELKAFKIRPARPGELPPKPPAPPPEPPEPTE